MAGIGFQLKKLFSDNNTTLENIRAVGFSTLVAAGPWILTTVTLNVLAVIGEKYLLTRSDRNLFMITIVYTFIFSQILYGGFQYLVARYLSDCIYTRNRHKLRSAYIGTTTTIIFLAFFIALVALKKADLPHYYKYTGIILFSTVSGIWNTMNFIGLIKSYSHSVWAYIWGNFTALVIGIYFLKFTEISFIRENMAYSMVLAYTLGMLVTFLILSSYILGILGREKTGDFEYINAAGSYPSLILIGIFFNVGIWGHVFVNWLYGDSYIIKNFFITSPFYEVTVFYAFFINIPTLVYFLVFMETKFFPAYKRYYAFLAMKGDLEQIDNSKKEMFEIFRREIEYIMELQFFLCVSAALLSKTIFYYLGMDLYLLDLFRIMLFSAFAAMFVSIFIIIFLYFDARKEALILSFFYGMSSVFFTYFFTKLGNDYSGMGFFLASFLSLLIANQFIENIENNLNYITFYKENFLHTKELRSLRVVEKMMNQKLYILFGLILLFLLSGCTAYDKTGFNKETGRNWHTMSYYDLDGYNIEGYTREGIDKKGFTKDGYHKYNESKYDYYGFDVSGIHQVTGKKEDERGFNQEKINIFTGTIYDGEGFDLSGIHKVTGKKWNEEGWTWYGLNEKTETYYDIDGYSKEGVNEKGFTKAGYHEANKSKYDYYGFDVSGIHQVTGKKEDERGFNQEKINVFTGTEYDKNNFDRDGIHKVTGKEYDEKGWTWYGLNKKTGTYYDVSGYTVDGLDKDGYKKGYTGPRNVENLSPDDPGWRDKDGFNKEGVYIDE
ncbi:MAG: exopolysaccharide Pel transporter PelG [Fusobacteriaceae bacterium]